MYLTKQTTMNSFVLIGVICFASVAFGYPQPEIVENDQGDVFQLIPLTRVRRDDNNNKNNNGLYGNVDITDPGRLIVGTRNTPINNANHRLDTHVFATDNIRHHSPLTTGGEVNYFHKPSQSTFDASAVHTEKWGTDLKAAGRYNFYQDKTSNANIEGYASKHIGGFPGNSRTDYGAFLNFRKTF